MSNNVLDMVINLWENLANFAHGKMHLIKINGKKKTIYFQDILNWMVMLKEHTKLY